MTQLLAILCYLQVIATPPAYITYTTCQIQQMEIEHHIEILQVQEDPALNAYVQAEYTDEAESIIVIDETCN